MNTYTLIILILVGLLTGAFGGIFGIGGATIMIPALIFLAGFNEHQAIGTSLAVLLPPIGFFAAYNYYKAGNVNITFALILAVTFMIGSYFSSKFALDIPENILRKAFSILLVLIAAKMYFTK